MGQLAPDAVRKAPEHKNKLVLGSVGLHFEISAPQGTAGRVSGGSTGDRQSASKPPGKANHVPQQHGNTFTQPKYYFSYQTACSLRRCSSPGLLGSQGGALGL